MSNIFKIIGINIVKAEKTMIMEAGLRWGINAVKSIFKYKFYKKKNWQAYTIWIRSKNNSDLYYENCYNYYLNGNKYNNLKTFQH